jgi:hypothetical protein
MLTDARWEFTFGYDHHLPATDHPTMNLFHRIYNYVVAQRLVPFHLPATERELRSWEALGEAYCCLRDIKYAKSLTEAQIWAEDAAGRCVQSGHLP